MMHRIAAKLGLAGTLAVAIALIPQAQAAPAATKPTAGRTAAGSDAGDKKSRSAACSAEADKKGLHGKERKKFRSKCKRQGAE